jgi:hypothetical protein
LRPWNLIAATSALTTVSVILAYSAVKVMLDMQASIEFEKFKHHQEEISQGNSVLSDSIVP